MFCCRSREKRETTDSVSKKEMIERYILSNCRAEPENSIDQSVVRLPVEDVSTYEEALWTNTEWMKIVHTKKVNQVDREQLRRNIRSGINETIRLQTWIWLCQLSITSQKYTMDIYQKLKAQPSMFDHEIFKDIKSLENKDILFDILRAYANYDNKCGYRSGMNLIIIYLCQKMDQNDDETIFWMMVHVMNHYRPIYMQSISFIETDKFKNTLTLAVQLHLARFKPLNQLLEQPLLILMKNNLKSKDFDRVFDTFLFEGESILLQILLKLIKLSESVICMLQSQADLTIYLNQSLINYAMAHANINILLN